MNDRERALVLAGLLHDAGKFEFRASAQRQAHARYGEYFVSEFLGKVPSLEHLVEPVRRLVALHHSGDAGDPVLAEADGLAASERTAEPSTQTLRSLVSVLSLVDLGPRRSGKPPADVHCYAPGKVEFAQPFPERQPGVTLATWQPDPEAAYAQHARAWEEFCADVRRLPEAPADAWIASLQYVAARHLTRVVSAAYKSEPDIALYDHGKAVAAIALCLERAGAEREPFALIRGDVSGIQRFIYQLASPEEEGTTRRMAKRLRGRSLYLALLVETAARVLLQALDLPDTNLLYCGGGHFLVLAPQGPRWTQAAAAAEERINRWLLAAHRGALALALGTVTAAREQLRDFGALMERAAAALEAAKAQKFRAVLEPALFAPQDFGSGMDVCPICQADFARKEGSICRQCQAHAAAGQSLWQARYLVRLDLQAPTRDAASELPPQSQCELAADFGELGCHWVLAPDREAVRLLLAEASPARYARAHVERLNDTEYLEELRTPAAAARLAVSYGWRGLAQYAPAAAAGDGPMEFAELAAGGAGGAGAQTAGPQGAAAETGARPAAAAAGATGDAAQPGAEQPYALLGWVRADVDFLGEVFAVGLRERRSLSRAAALSRELDGFFGGYVNHLAARCGVYLVYAGGDDVFAVGAWRQALRFARELRADFGRFACGNPHLTLSAGVLLSKPSFPVGRAAQLAGELEEQAKRYPASSRLVGRQRIVTAAAEPAGHGARPAPAAAAADWRQAAPTKDAVALFGEVVTWGELDELLAYGDQLLQLVQQGQVTTHLLYRILALSLDSREARPEAQAAGALAGGEPGLQIRRLVRNHVRLKYLLARHGVGASAVRAVAAQAGQPGPVGPAARPPEKSAVLGRLAVDASGLFELAVVPLSYVLYQLRRPARGKE